MHVSSALHVKYVDVAVQNKLPEMFADCVKNLNTVDTILVPLLIKAEKLKMKQSGNRAPYFPQGYNVLTETV